MDDSGWNQLLRRMVGDENLPAAAVEHLSSIQVGAEWYAQGVERQEVSYFQDARGQLPLSPVNTDARWRTTRSGTPSGLNYQESIIVDLGGFILSRGVTHASEGEWKALLELLEKLPLKPVSLAADTAYSVGQLRELLEEKGITAYIPKASGSFSVVIAFSMWDQDLGERYSVRSRQES